MLEDVPCDQLPSVLEALVPYATGKHTTPKPAASLPPPAQSSEYANP
jgi:hypothetical protein